MAVKGRIHIFNNPGSGNLEVVAENLGETPGVFTHNIQPDQKTAHSGNAYTQHDDQRYGHGDNTPAGTEDQPGTVIKNFPLDSDYIGNTAEAGSHTTKVTHGAWLRVGFRYKAWKAIEIPPPGEVVTIDYTEMTAGTCERTTNNHQAWNPVATSSTVGAGRNLSGPLAQIYGATADGPANIIEGTASIAPVADGRGQLKGWEVRFANEAKAPGTRGRTTGFIGTVVLTDQHGNGTKNAGLGLESMICPAGGYETVQFIRAGGDYGLKEHGVSGEPGTKIRLGIRGHSLLETSLPTLEEGPRKLPLEDFEESASDVKSAWFETGPLLEKLGEKKAFLDIYRDGARINDELPDTIYTGEEAFTKAEFKDPPQIVAEWIDADDRLPKGGWRIEVTNRLPDEDNIGPLGFAGRIAVPQGDQLVDDAVQLPRQRFDAKQRSRTYEIDASKALAGQKVAPGFEVALDTGPLGWRARFALPAPNQPFDSAASQDLQEQVWVLRETDFKRADLTPKVILRGDEAEEAAMVPSPRLSVTRVADGEETPGGGWTIEMESRAEADSGVGFVGTLKLGAGGKDAAILPPKKFETHGDINRWFLPNGANLSGTIAEDDAQLVVGTRGLGWYAVVQLPAEGEGVDGESWAYRDDQFERDNLTPEFIAGCRLGPDVKAGDAE